MKPVNLHPGKNATASVATSGAPNLGVIGGAAAGVVVLLFVAGFLAMARVDSVKSEAAKLQSDATAADAKTAATRAQIATIGQPVVDSDKQLAQGAEQVLVTAFTERHDFVLAARELRGVMNGTGGWYVKVDVAAAGAQVGSGGGTDGGQAVTIEGYMPTKELAAGFNERVDGTRTLSNALTTSLKSERMVAGKGKKPGTYWHFVLSADFIDTVTPSADGGAAADLSSGGTTVAGGTGGGSEELTLSLDPEYVAPKPKVTAKAKPVVAAKPVKVTVPLEQAASAAAAGGSK